jgi:enterochelin esterase-like enzyme
VDEEASVFGPTGWVFFGALVLAFAGLLYCLVRVGHIALKVVAGVVAFAVSSLFGAALVNQYYAYYTTWGALFADASGSNVVGYQASFGTNQTGGHQHRGMITSRPFVTPPPPTLAPLPSSEVAPSIAIPRLALKAEPTSGSGRVVRLDLPGARSGITRKGFVYLPPQYFEPAYVHTSFPVLELLHGDPGDPSGWVYALQVPDVMDRAIDSGTIGPMIVVMPATFDGKHGQDCVDAPGGQLDDTYLTTDIAADLAHDFRVLPQGANWAIGGLSDGGFCAANLALRHPGSYGAVVSLDGFYATDSDLAVLNRIFGAGSPLIQANDPSALAVDVRSSLPRFWIMSGSGDLADTWDAQYVKQILTTREPIEYVVVRNGRHTPAAWRVALPSMLSWTWNAISGGPVGTGTMELGDAAPPSRAPLASAPAKHA